MLDSKKKKLYFLISIFIIITMVLVTVARSIYFATFTNIVDELKRSANGIAVTAAKFIEQDIEEYLELTSVTDYSDGNYNKEYYDRMRNLFHSIKEESGVTYIYTEKLISDSEVIYILDGEDPESEYFSPIGTVDYIDETERDVFKEGKAMATNLIKDEYWGTFISGYAPIMNLKTGEVVGLVGVDFSIDYVRDFLKNIENRIIVITIPAILMFTIILYKLIESKQAALYTDHMTGLYSKRYHEESLRKLILEAEKTNHPLSLIMIDVDYFKQINDKYGHVIGDEVIKLIAQNIKNSIRITDCCSRFGGDEFIIVLPNTDKDMAVVIAERIKASMHAYNLLDKKALDIDFDLTLSIGIAEWGKDITDVQLAQHADNAMYISKQNGRDTITVYEEVY